MEKITNRGLYFRDFIEFSQIVKLNEHLMKTLEKHRYFSDEMKSVVKKLNTEDEKKLFILIWFTRSRSTCEEMVKILRDSGLSEAADRLHKYNTSNGLMEFRDTADIPITEANNPLKGSAYYPMHSTPRGKCIIINNVSEELFMESERFRIVFEKLHFNVKVYNDLTVPQIETKLHKIAKSIETSDAFVLMVLSHGSNEQILGYNACKAFINFNEREAQEVIDTDVIKITKIVDIFSDTNCQVLRNKPKLFFFTCCRNKTEDYLQKTNEKSNQPNEKPVNTLATPFTEVPTHENRTFDKLETLNEKWSNDNKDTFICYSCAEGYKSFYDSNIGISHFGQALSHTIAQYACEETLNTIISRTSDYLQQYSDQSGNYAPEFRGKCMRRQLSFNP